MNDKYLYFLLQIIRNNKDVSLLINEGLTYFQITKYTKFALQKKLIEFVDDKIQLSVSGKVCYQKLGSTYKKTNKEEWIEKDLKNKISTLDKSIIFVPRQDELTF